MSSVESDQSSIIKVITESKGLLQLLTDFIMATMKVIGIIQSETSKSEKEAEVRDVFKTPEFQVVNSNQARINNHMYTLKTLRNALLIVLTLAGGDAIRRFIRDCQDKTDKDHSDNHFSEQNQLSLHDKLHNCIKQLKIYEIITSLGSSISQLIKEFPGFVGNLLTFTKKKQEFVSLP